MRDVDLELEPNEASDLCPVFASSILDGPGWDRALVTVLDEAPVERAVAVLGHARGADADTGWQVRRVRLKVSDNDSTDDAEACARHGGWIYVFGSQFGSKDGPLQAKRSWVARVREDAMAAGLDGSKVKADVALLEFGLHRAANDALEQAGIDLLPMGRTTRLTYIDATIRRAARKDRPWADRIISSDHPINVEAADFRANGRLLLGLRYPVTADGAPILIEVDDVDSLFESPQAPPRCPAVHVLDAGSREVPVGLRALHGDGTDRFHALLGNLDSTGKSAAILEDHPEGATATTSHVRFELPAPQPGARVATELIRDFAGLRRVEGVALSSSGHFHYVVDREGRLALRTMLASETSAGETG